MLAGRRHRVLSNDIAGISSMKATSFRRSPASVAGCRRRRGRLHYYWLRYRLEGSGFTGD